MSATDSTLLVLLLAAFIVGIGKTAFGGLALVSTALFALVLPARESTGALLLLLLVGDAVAVFLYRSHVEWRALARLSPSVAAGVLLGAWVMSHLNDFSLGRLIGAVVLVMVAGQMFVQVARARAGQSLTHLPQLVTAGFGATAGLTSMLANAGGPIMTVYLLNMNLGVSAFLATNAWFFACVNLFKLPFSISMGLVTTSAWQSLWYLAPAVLLGALAGRLLVGRISQRAFTNISLASAGAVGINLLLR